MKNFIFGIVAFILFIGGLFWGQTVSFQEQVRSSTNRLLKRSLKYPDPVGKTLAPTETNLQTQHQLEQVQHKKNVEQLAQLKIYEKIKLTETQKESFKKVFLEIAARRDVNWLVQRQALRNLFLQKIKLSQEEMKKIMAQTDRRALYNAKLSDRELLQEFVDESVAAGSL